MLRARATRWFERRWYGGVAPNWLLRRLSVWFEREVVKRRARYLAALANPAGGDDAPQRAGVPVLVVGNLAVGGAGKTPLVIALVDALRRRGFRPGVISRGYGRQGTAVCRIQADAAPDSVGDEPLLIARRTGVPVAVAARRIEAARLLADRGEVDVLIADDGLQHYALARDIEILVVDGQRRFGNGHVLPAGPLREPVERASACDFTVVNGGTAQHGEVPMRLEPAGAQPLKEGGLRTLESFSGTQVHAVAAIGNPDRFFAALRARGIGVIGHAFPDHHAFVASDLDFGDSVPVLMTEKDAVKCREFAKDRWYVVPVDAQLPEVFFDAVAARLAALKDVTK